MGNANPEPFDYVPPWRGDDFPHDFEPPDSPHRPAPRSNPPSRLRRRQGVLRQHPEMASSTSCFGSWSEYSSGSIFSSTHIFVSGAFPVVPSYDLDLQMEFKVNVREHPKSYRIAAVSGTAEQRECLLAVSRMVPRGASWNHSDASYGVTVFNAVTGTPLVRMGEAVQSIRGLACVSSCTSFDAPVILFGGPGLRAFDSETGRKLMDFPGIHSVSRISTMPSLCPDYVFVGSEKPGTLVSMNECGLSAFSLVTGLESGYRGHVKAIRGITSDVTRRLLISCSEDKTVAFWGVVNQSCQHVLELSRPGESVLYVEDRNLLLVGLSNGSVAMWDVRQLEGPLNRVKLSRGRVTDLCRISASECVSVSSCKRDNVAAFDFAGNLRVSSTAPARCFGCCVIGEIGRSDDEIGEFARRLEMIVSLSVPHRLCILVYNIAGEPTRIESTAGLLLWSVF